MSVVQYAYCVVYGMLSVGLMCLIAAQKGQEKNGLSALSGNTNDTYYSRNLSHTPESLMKAWTKALAVVWVLMSGAGFFFLG